MKLRNITASDLDTLSKLYVKTFESPPWNETWREDWAKERLELIFQSPLFHGFIAYTGKEPIGAILARENSFKGNKEVEIVELFIAPKEQHKGYGKYLLKEFEKHCLNCGIKYILLLTSHNVDAFNFYTQLGYQPNQEIKLLTKAL